MQQQIKVILKMNKPTNLSLECTKTNKHQFNWYLEDWIKYYYNHQSIIFFYKLTLHINISTQIMIDF